MIQMGLKFSNSYNFLGQLFKFYSKFDQSLLNFHKFSKVGTHFEKLAQVL